MAAYPKHCLDLDLWVGDGCAEDQATDAADAIDTHAGRRSMKGSLTALTSTSGLAMAVRKAKRPMRPKPLIPMLVGGP